MAKKDNKNENKAKKHFFKDFKAELKKVIWPTPKQLVNNTVAVITIVLITAAIVFVLDVAFDMANKYGISRLQNIVNEKYNSEEENTNNIDNGEEDTETENEEGLEGENTTTEETTSEGEDMTTEQNAENTSTTDETTIDGEQTNPEQ